ncbi:hypothetical protein MAHJHV61_18740 [Mycobacterium avium subsp. hominissuis]
MPGTVSDVSATLVASTTRRPVWGANTFCCSAVGSRAYSGSTSVCFSAVKASAVSRISRSPDRNTNTSPGGSASSSAIASTIASTSSRVSVRTISWSGSSGSSAVAEGRAISSGR